MRTIKRLALAGVLAIFGCGPDDSVAPSDDLADAWVGQYSGTGSYALSNGETGTDKPTTLVITAVNPKEIMVSVKLVYGGRAGQEAGANAMLTPTDADELTAEYRLRNSRIAFILTRQDKAIRGSILTSSARVGGTWTEDQRMSIEVARP